MSDEAAAAADNIKSNLLIGKERGREGKTTAHRHWANKNMGISSREIRHGEEKEEDTLLSFLFPLSARGNGGGMSLFTGESAKIQSCRSIESPFLFFAVSLPRQSRQKQDETFPLLLLTRISLGLEEEGGRNLVPRCSL